MTAWNGCEKLAFLKDLKNVRRGRIRDFAQLSTGQYFDKATAMGREMRRSVAVRTQNEIGGREAEKLLRNGCMWRRGRREHASSLEAVEHVSQPRFCSGPAKAAQRGRCSR